MQERQNTMIGRVQAFAGSLQAFVVRGFHRHPVLSGLWCIALIVLSTNVWQACWDEGSVSVIRRARIVSMFDLPETREIHGIRSSGGGMPWRFDHLKVNCAVIPGDEPCFIDVGDSRRNFERYREGQQVETAVVLAKPKGMFAWTREAATAAWLIAIALLGWFAVVAVLESTGRE